jgi:undecaprenyl-diphosphatase
VSPAEIAAAAAAAIVALLTLRRWRSSGTAARAGGLGLAVALAVYASGVLSRLPNAEHVIEDLAQALGPWTYALVGGMAFLETGAFVGFIAPGEFTVILGGVIAGEGEIAILPLIGLVWLCAALGDSLSFLIGHRLGRAWLLEHGDRIRITRERFAKVEGYFRRHGGKTVLIGRFIGFVRPLAPFIAGSSGMRYARFLPYSVLGTGLWGSSLCLAGYAFWRSFSKVASIAGRATLVFGALVTLVVLGVVAYRRLRVPAERARLAAWIERQGERPLLRPVYAVTGRAWRWALRPLARIAWPEVRFVAGRLTPGNLGIEFTTLLAACGAGFYVFALYASDISSHHRYATGDRQAIDVVRDLRTSTGVDVLKVVTDLGALPAVIALVALTGMLLIARRRPLELLVLAGGLAALVLAVTLTKAGIDRPRPPGALVHTNGASYPSGHAAYATAYLGVGVALNRVFRGIARGAVFIVVGVAVAGVVGLSRVYLLAHYWSDVVGGWSLGVGVFALAGALALVVAHVRQNLRTPAASARGPGQP